MKEEYKNNPNFYPTPKKLIKKMLSKVSNWNNVKTILEPSAGNGAIVDYIKEENRYYGPRLLVIEKDPELQKELLRKNYSLIDSDFLLYDGQEQVDLIIANFPFSEGDRHLLKAIECMFSGEIVCLINAETLKNPYTSTRKELALKLKQLKASITFLKDEFIDSARSTKVEVALIHIIIETTVEDSLFKDLKKDDEINVEEIKNFYELANLNKIESLVLSYNKEKECVINQIINFYQNYNTVGKWIEVRVLSDDNPNKRESNINLTDIMKSKINQFVYELKKQYWGKILVLDEISKHLTHKKKGELNSQMKKFIEMSFTEENIRLVIQNLIDKFASSIDEAILELFDDLTKYALKDDRWFNEEYAANIHYYNAWKSNSGYKINKKVIIRFYYERSWSDGSRTLRWEQENQIADIERVISYFSEKKDLNLVKLIQSEFAKGNTKNISNDLLSFTFYKKGTCHIEFKNEDVLRKFNIEVAKLRNFLPMDYGDKDIKDLNPEELNTVNSFENLKTYKKLKNKKITQILLDFQEN